MKRVIRMAKTGNNVRTLIFFYIVCILTSRCFHRLGVCCAKLEDPKALMKTGLSMVLVGHVNFLLGALVHGAVLRHIHFHKEDTAIEYTVSNVTALSAGLLGVVVGVLAIILSKNKTSKALTWCLLTVGVVAGLTATMSAIGITVSVAKAVIHKGRSLLTHCRLPDTIGYTAATDECPFDPTRIYSTTLILWVPLIAVCVAQLVFSARCVTVCLESLRLCCWSRKMPTGHKRKINAVTPLELTVTPCYVPHHHHEPHHRSLPLSERQPLHQHRSLPPSDMQPLHHHRSLPPSDTQPLHHHRSVPPSDTQPLHHRSLPPSERQPLHQHRSLPPSDTQPLHQHCSLPPSDTQPLHQHCSLPPSDTQPLHHHRSVPPSDTQPFHHRSLPPSERQPLHQHLLLPSSDTQPLHQHRSLPPSERRPLHPPRRERTAGSVFCQQRAPEQQQQHHHHHLPERASLKRSGFWV